MRYLALLNTIKVKCLPKPKESQLLLGRWTIHSDEDKKTLSMSNSNIDNCSYNHNVSIEQLVVMSHNSSKPSR